MVYRLVILKIFEQHMPINGSKCANNYRLVFHRAEMSTVDEYTNSVGRMTSRADNLRKKEEG